MRRLGVLIVGLLLAGCASAPRALWGTVIAIAAVEQTDAPALHAAPDGLTFAWASAEPPDQPGAALLIRRLSASGFGAAAPAARTPRPYALSLYPAAGDNLHLLWLDADETGATALHGALLAADGTFARGPLRWNPHPARRYTALAGGDASLWVVISGGPPSEPALYTQYIDPQGRPRAADDRPLLTGADWPVFVSGSDGTAELFWFKPADGRIWRADFSGGFIGASAPVVEPPALAPGDRLDSLTAARDRSHHYLFWNITRADGRAQTWFASGLTRATDWLPPQRLGVRALDETDFATGFNTGAAQRAASGSDWLRQAAPLAGLWTQALPVAAVTDAGLAVVYFQQGAAAGFQLVVPDVRLIGQPTLAADRDRYLYLVWMQPNADRAALRLTTMRPLPAS